MSRLAWTRADAAAMGRGELGRAPRAGPRSLEAQKTLRVARLTGGSAPRRPSARWPPARGEIARVHTAGSGGDAVARAIHERIARAPEAFLDEQAAFGASYAAQSAPIIAPSCALHRVGLRLGLPRGRQRRADPDFAALLGTPPPPPILLPDATTSLLHSPLGIAAARREALAQPSRPARADGPTDDDDRTDGRDGAPPAPAPEEDPSTSFGMRFLPPPRPAPVGRAAPATEAASHGEGYVRAGLEVFAQYRFRQSQTTAGESEWFHEFDVPRVHAAIEGGNATLRGRVLVEATRSASEGSLIGVAGDSLVLRVREAYAAFRPVAWASFDAGVVPTLTIPELDGTWMTRAVAPSALEERPGVAGRPGRTDPPPPSAPVRLGGDGGVQR